MRVVKGTCKGMDLDLRRVRELHSQGCGYIKSARELGVTPRVIRTAWLKMGLGPCKAAQWPLEKIVALRHGAAKGVAWSKLAFEVGMSETAVRTKAKTLGLMKPKADRNETWQAKRQWSNQDKRLLVKYVREDELAWSTIAKKLRHTEHNCRRTYEKLLNLERGFEITLLPEKDNSGLIRCLGYCGKKFMSPDKVRVRRCHSCKDMAARVYEGGV